MGRDCRPRDGGLEIDGWAAIDGAHQKCGLQHPDKESHNSSGAPDSTGFANANGSLGRVDSSGSSDMSQNDLQAESKLARQRSTVATFSTDHDHRLAMAAAVANVAGHSIEILDPHVVNKSFPGFWDIVRASGVTV